MELLGWRGIRFLLLTKNFLFFVQCDILADRQSTNWCLKMLMRQSLWRSIRSARKLALLTKVCIKAAVGEKDEVCICPGTRTSSWCENMAARKMDCSKWMQNLSCKARFNQAFGMRSHATSHRRDQFFYCISHRHQNHSLREATIKALLFWCYCLGQKQLLEPLQPSDQYSGSASFPRERPRRRHWQHPFPRPPSPH